MGYFGGIVCVLIAYYRKFVFGLSHVFFPRFSYLSGRNDTEGTRRLFFRGSRYVSIVSSAVFLLLWSVGPAFLNLWIENDNIQQAFPALIALAAGALVYTTHRISTDLLFGLGKQRQLAVLSMTEGLLVLCLCIMLCPSYGMTGAAVAISLPIILVRGIIQTKLVCRLLAVGFWKYYAECVLTAWLVAFVIAAVCKMVGTFRIVNDWFVLFFTSGLVLILYGVSVYSMALKSEDRREFKVRVFACFNKLAGKRYA